MRRVLRRIVSGVFMGLVLVALMPLAVIISIGLWVTE